MELRKEAKYFEILRKSNFAPPTCSYVAVQKGHMIEQVMNKRLSVEEFTKQLTQRKRVVDPLSYRKD